MPTSENSNAGLPLWPEIAEGYPDQFGPIDHEVYEIAGTLWSPVQPFIRRTINDVDAAQTLMLKAVAIASRRRIEQPDKMTNLRSYLAVIFKRLVLAELEKTARNEPIDEKKIEDAVIEAAQLQPEIERDILVREIMERADDWTKEIFEWLILGYSFEELTAKFGMKANRLRSKWSKSMSRLRKEIESEMGGKEQ